MWNVEQCAHVPVRRGHRQCLKPRYGDRPSLSEVLKISFTGLDSSFPAPTGPGQESGLGPGPGWASSSPERCDWSSYLGSSRRWGVCWGEGHRMWKLPVIGPASCWVTSSPQLPARTSVNYLVVRPDGGRLLPGSRSLCWDWKQLAPGAPTTWAHRPSGCSYIR